MTSLVEGFTFRAVSVKFLAKCVARWRGFSVFGMRRFYEQEKKIV